MDAPGEVPELLQRLAELPTDLVDRPLCLCVVLEALLEEAELEREGDEPLLRAVVQVALRRRRSASPASWVLRDADQGLHRV